MAKMESDEKPDPAIKAFAVVTVELEVELAQPWGGDATVDTVFKTAIRDAEERVENALRRSHDSSCIRLRRAVRREDVRMVIVKETKR